jgi:hypothetical protein
MDADNAPAFRTTIAPGGTVEPANRATIAKELYQTPVDVPSQRYELRDPFAEITYRSNNLLGIVAKAEQLGMTKFVAIDAQGNRGSMQKVGDEWHGAPPAGVAVQEAAAPSPQKSNATADIKASKPIAPIEAAQQQQVVSKIDAQAERAVQVLRIEAMLSDRYLIKRAPVTVGDVTMCRP